MSSRIRILDDLTINQMAAGEVIENSASVVKELVDNAIDAGAREICIEIRGGGRQLIRVSDNGCGMNSDDALLSLERHATSKITSVDELYKITTRGFRGEALPSIASISKLTILTTASTNHKDATMIVVEGGKILRCETSVREKGSTIEVKDLFYNVPVRKKFLKSPVYDAQEIQKVIGALALANIHINFELIADRQSILRTSLPQALNQHETFLLRIKEVLGNSYTDKSIKVDWQKEDVHFWGILAPTSEHRNTRTGQFLFINGRPVYSLLISNAVRDAFGLRLPPGRHPLFVLNLQLPGSEIDINVHPQKKEVRFKNELWMKELTLRAIESAFVPEIFISPKLPLAASFASCSYESTLPWEQPEIQTSLPEAALKIRELSDSQQKTELVLPLNQIVDPTPVVSPKVIGALSGYFIIELQQKFGMESVCVVDQRAAHARVLYEDLLKKSQDKIPFSSQGLLVPLTIDLHVDECRRLKSCLEALQILGFSLREFGSHTFLVDALPSFMQENQVKTFLIEWLQELPANYLDASLMRDKIHELAWLAAAKAINFSKKLSLDEAQYLVNQLMRCECPYESPQGRPTLVRLSSSELEPLFGAK